LEWYEKALGIRSHTTESPHPGDEDHQASSFKAPCCTEGHELAITEFAEDDYKGGVFCNGCPCMIDSTSVLTRRTRRIPSDSRQEGLDFLGTSMRRWWCTSCRVNGGYDLCLWCVPEPLARGGVDDPDVAVTSRNVANINEKLGK
jgi:hypothetical protein